MCSPVSEVCVCSPVSQVSVPKDLVAVMSAVRDGQEVDPQDCGRIIYRFRQTVGRVSFIPYSPDIIIIITRPQV